MASCAGRCISLYKSVVLRTVVAPGGHTEDHVKHLYTCELRVACGGTLRTVGFSTQGRSGRKASLKHSFLALTNCDLV